MSLRNGLSRALGWGRKVNLPTCSQPIVSQRFLSSDQTSDDFRRTPSSYRTFPNFQVNMKDKPPLVKAPRFVVFANIVLDGQTHNKKSYAAKDPFEEETGQSFMDVYEGTVMAASAVTEALSQENPDEGNVTSMMTEEMAERLTPWLGLAPDDHINSRDLISMPARDILLSYLDNMSKNGQGEYTALLVTYSFPAYGFMVRKLQENRARVEEFQAGSQERVKGLSMSEAREVTADIRKEANEFGKTLFRADPWFAYHPVVVSNFHFVRRDGTWLLDGISMADTKGVLNKFSHFKWKGRMSMALKMRWIDGVFIKSLRFDYITDLMIGCSIFAALTMPFFDPNLITNI